VDIAVQVVNFSLVRRLLEWSRPVNKQNFEWRFRQAGSQRPYFARTKTGLSERCVFHKFSPRGIGIAEQKVFPNLVSIAVFLFDLYSTPRIPAHAQMPLPSFANYAKLIMPFRKRRLQNLPSIVAFAPLANMVNDRSFHCLQRGYGFAQKGACINRAFAIISGMPSRCRP